MFLSVLVSQALLRIVLAVSLTLNMKLRFSTCSKGCGQVFNGQRVPRSWAWGNIFNKVVVSSKMLGWEGHSLGRSYAVGPCSVFNTLMHTGDAREKIDMKASKIYLTEEPFYVLGNVGTF